MLRKNREEITSPRIVKILLVFDDGSTKEVDSTVCKNVVRKFHANNPKYMIEIAIAVLTVMRETM